MERADDVHDRLDLGSCASLDSATTMRWLVATLLTLAAGALLARRRDAANFQGLAFGGRIPIGCVLVDAFVLLAVGVAWLLLDV